MSRRIGVFVALLVTLLGGWLWGTSGKSELTRAIRAAELRNDLLEAHVSLLGARVSFCDADYDEMSRQLETARGLVARASTRRGAADLTETPPQVDLAGIGTEITDAQRLAAKLRPGVCAPASE
jgi:hypothetical protein